jgi:predicted DNA-binding transcriptional regulator YafY
MTKALHHSQRIVDFDNHIIGISVIPNNELDALILSFGKDVEVLSPISYREKIQTIIKEAYDKYFTMQIDCTSL